MRACWRRMKTSCTCCSSVMPPHHGYGAAMVVSSVHAAYWQLFYTLSANTACDISSSVAVRLQAQNPRGLMWSLEISITASLIHFPLCHLMFNVIKINLLYIVYINEDWPNLCHKQFMTFRLHMEKHGVSSVKLMSFGPKWSFWPSLMP